MAVIAVSVHSMRMNVNTERSANFIINCVEYKFIAASCDMKMSSIESNKQLALYWTTRALLAAVGSFVECVTFII